MVRRAQPPTRPPFSRAAAEVRHALWPYGTCSTATFTTQYKVRARVWLVFRRPANKPPIDQLTGALFRSAVASARHGYVLARSAVCCPWCGCSPLPASSTLPREGEVLRQVVGTIVRSVMARAVAKETRMGASVIRLFFHDCFVNVGHTFISFRLRCISSS
jgi:hypothetical protein